MDTTIRRVNRSKEDARASYNRLSRWYDVIAGSTEKKYRDWGLQKLSAQPGERILEIGFGTGHCLVALAKAVGSEGRVLGVDISDGMLAIARERLQKEELSERVELHLGDAANLNFIEAGSLDGVFMSFTLELFDNPEIPRVLQECQRMLRNGGRLAVVSMTKTNPPGLAVRMYEWFHDHMPNYADCRPIFARQAIEQSGFAIQDVDGSSMWGLPVEIVLGKEA
ncbi:MAG: 2-heptaprenyl-1,4-naphthoquinone methyltransferase [Anaerolineae bacterium]|nr:MAG: 2-heptaprenyl-1,4-naphthoquinone methyltransferase [Anaerolineae bacterium]WKZ44960.1 MAG: methyltransferase domain-containing protein [Anaerolineales bacterium]